MSITFGKLAAVIAMGTILTGCETVIPNSVEMRTPPQINPITEQNASLRSLPPPTARIPVAVYGLPDLTGQYTESISGAQSLSRAVTQGGGDMLIKALQDAGERRWFTVLDRSRLDDTLRERQIVTEMRRIYRDEQRIPAEVLPPLQHAGVIVQGAITGYDSYTRTGGAGARYLGIGADTQWQQDTVTVSLRAISTNTSEVLASVTVHKAIASVSVQGGVFRYIQLDRILEAEAGATQNEPRFIAVQQAIEKAVIGLVIEGAELGVWRFASPERGRRAIEDYRQEKYHGQVPDIARTVPAPSTSNPAAVVPTRARPRPAPPPPPAVSSSQPPAPAAPPPADPSEVLG